MGHNLLINGVYWGYNPLILTIDPNFQRDILAGDDLFEPALGMVKLIRDPLKGRLGCWCPLGPE